MINDGVTDILEMIGQNLPILANIVSPFVGSNIKAKAIKVRVNNAIKFLYSLELVLWSRC